MHKHHAIPLIKKVMVIGASIYFRALVVTLAATALPVAAGAADLTVTISANVVTPLTLVEDQTLSFGSIAITSGSDDTASGGITLDADNGTVDDPLAEPNGANIVFLSGATVGEFTVFAGVAETIPMTITVPSMATLTFAGQDNLDVSAITVGTLTEGAGAAGDCSAGCNMVSATTGNIKFPVGATLTMAVGNGNYGDGTYSGSFTVTAVYQ